MYMSMCLCVCVCPGILSLSTAVRAKIVCDFYHFKWRPQSNKKKMSQKMRKSRPIQCRGIGGGKGEGRGTIKCSACFSVLFFLAGIFRFSGVVIVVVVVILSADLHYNLLCENCMHPTISFYFPMANFDATQRWR